MILPPVVRAFFAIDIPEQTKAKIGDYIDSLHKMSKSNVIRWSKPENLHITLQFIEEIQGQHVENLISNVRQELTNSLQSLTVSIKNLHLFPDPHRPRVLVLDVAPQDILSNISAVIGHGIEKTNYPIEQRKYRGHLSIGRIKTSKMQPLSFLNEISAPEIEDFTVNEVVLFQSEPHPNGSKYIPLERIALAGADSAKPTGT